MLCRLAYKRHGQIKTKFKGGTLMKQKNVPSEFKFDFALCHPADNSAGFQSAKKVPIYFYSLYPSPHNPRERLKDLKITLRRSQIRMSLLQKQ